MNEHSAMCNEGNSEIFFGYGMIPSLTSSETKLCVHTYVWSSCNKKRQSIVVLCRISSFSCMYIQAVSEGGETCPGNGLESTHAGNLLLKYIIIKTVCNSKSQPRKTSAQPSR